MKRQRHGFALGFIVIFVAGSIGRAAAEGVAMAQPAAPAGQTNGAFVTREEYDKLKSELEELKARFNAMKSEKTTNTIETIQSLDYVNQRVDQLEEDTRKFWPGFNRVIIAGDANATFISQEGSKSSFGAELAPLILWQLNDRLLFEGGFDIGIDNGGELGSGETTFDLSIAELSYLLNDYLTIGAGLFVVPFGVYHNHFDPPWINQLPDDPLPFGDGGIAADSAVGVFGEGAVPIGPTVLNYDVYVSNGPRLITDDPSAAGSLGFDNYVDNNNAKTFGGRIGFRPIPEVEFGYSMQYGQVGVDSFRNVDAFLQAVDAEFRRDYSRIYGQIDFRAELVLSHVDRATYGLTASPPFGPFTFNNNRNGGYVQIGYRPWMVDLPVISKLQLVGRYDWLHSSLAAPGGDRENRWTAGLNYWLQPNVVLKGAYEFDHKKSGQDADAVLVQLGIGL
ncbi:MAG: hypothetical protein M1608_10110 [Candidatus Omnitrophica bacterium]|nr:hypothetical protein [Candidatus Omnitrophota bacterium]